MKHLSTIFQRVRKRTKLTQKQMASCIGISEFNLSRIENGKSTLKASYIANLHRAGVFSEQDVFDVMNLLADYEENTVSSLRNLVLDLIDQIEMTDFEDTGSYLKNNIAYVALKNAVNEKIHIGDEQSFKSSINDMVRIAARDGGTATLKNCESKVNGEMVKFEIDVRVKDSEVG